MRKAVRTDKKDIKELIHEKEPETWKQKAGVYAKAAAGIAVLASMASMAVSPVYSVPFRAASGYGPGSFEAIYQGGGIPDVEMAMLADIYNGVMVSGSGYYRTEEFYPVGQWKNWVWALETSYFYSTKPKTLQLWYDNSNPGMCQVSVEFADTDMEAVRQKDAAYLAEVDRLVSEVAGKTVGETIRYYHDYLTGHCEYDKSLTRSRAYDCLIGGSSVCNGYAVAFYNLCSAAGLEVGYITGTVTAQGADRIPHAWNRVKMENGEWRYYDITWDDTLGSDQYYGITEKEMNRDHFPETVI